MGSFPFAAPRRSRPVPFGQGWRTAIAPSAPVASIGSNSSPTIRPAAPALRRRQSNVQRDSFPRIPIRSPYAGGLRVAPRIERGPPAARS